MQKNRIITVASIVSVLFGMLLTLPSVSAQSSTASTIARVSAQQFSFDPTRGERANIQYRITEGVARDVTVDLYYSAPPRSSDPGLCNRSNQFFVGTIDGPADKAVGTYTATLTGLLRDGTPENQGNYCYHIQWANPQIGALGFVDGIVELRHSTTISTGGTGTSGTNTGGTGTSGTNTGGTGTSGTNTSGTGTSGTNTVVIVSGVGTTVTNTSGTASGGTTISTSPTPPSNQLCSSPYGFVDSRVDTTTIDLRTNSLANITYKTCTGIPRGTSFSFGIYDDRGVPTRLYFSHNQGVPQGYTSALSWNGTNSSGNNVQENKTYFYKFKVNGLDDSTGTINVIRSTAYVPPQEPVTLNHYVSPSLIQVDNVRNISLNSSIINFEFNKTITPTSSFSVVLDSGPGLTTLLPLFTTNQSIRSGSASWNGLIGNRIAAEGSYRYAIRLDGQTLGTGYITVQNVGQPPAVLPVITDRGPDPSTIIVGNQTNFRFNLNQRANVTLNIYEPIFENSRLIRSITTSRPSGETSITFDGKDQNGSNLSANIYSYELRASNSNGVATPRTGILRVSEGGTTTPFITDNGPDRFTFDPTRGESSNFTFTLNVPASVDFSLIDNSGRFIRNLLTSTQSNNTNTGTNSVRWDGRDANGGTIVSDGLYTYIITAIGGNTVRGTVRIQRIGGGNNLLDITNLTATPDPFNPTLNSGIDFSYTLNNPANVTVTVFQDVNNSNVFVKRLQSNASIQSGIQRIRWDGRNENNQVVGYGSYLFTVDASSSQYGSDTESKRFVVSTSGGNRSFQITDLRAFPNPFDADSRDTEIRFKINESARITVRIISERTGETSRTLTTDRIYSDSEVSIIWDGKDRLGRTVEDGRYNVVVDGRSERQGAYDSKSLLVTVDSFGHGGGNFEIRNHSAQPTTFNPYNGETSTITFTLTDRPQSVGVQILTESTQALVANLTVEELGSNTYRARWNGRNFANNQLVTTNTQYRYFITARQNSITDTATGIIYVSNNGGGGGGGDCGNFRDVSYGDPLCPAIKFVVDRGIFKGYPDKTIGLNNVIQRAEMAAVLQKLFQYPLDVYDERRDGDLGLIDLRGKEREWYMPYLKTFNNRRLMVGYPDRRMRPEKTMNTAELYLVFLKAAQSSPKSVANFTIDSNVRHAPYRDTPLTRDNEWYIRYAAFAQINGLINGDYFNPAKGITRRQVIQLIYDANNKGLITCPIAGFYDNFNDDEYYIYYNDNNRYDYTYEYSYNNSDRYSRDQYGNYYQDTNGNYYRDNNGNYNRI